jgi:predicted flap endonuclease-1-like 5' DNA nuclease
MQFEFPALQSEPLIYFLLHSSLFVLILGALFFSLGLWFGGLTWRKYKGQCKVTHDKNQALLGEIAVLKRKLAEQSLRPATAATAPATPQTESLAKACDFFPERPTATAASTPTSSASAAQTLKAAIPKSATKSELLIDRSAAPSAPAPVTAAEPDMDPVLGTIYREAPPHADDLTKIKGINGHLAKRLHELGVHCFHQMASWEDKHIREFSNQLAFKDRITREGWVSQARDLEQTRASK